jgi:hypothetical protein
MPNCTADVCINVPPPSGTLTMTVGQTLEIHAAQACTFCCSIGGNFSPSLSNVQLAQGKNGPYTAETAGTGSYSTSDKGQPCNTSARNPAATAQSVQINNPPPPAQS